MKKIILALFSILLLASCDISITNSKDNSSTASQEDVSKSSSSSSSFKQSSSSSSSSKQSSSSSGSSKQSSSSSSSSKQSSSSSSSFKQSSSSSSSSKQSSSSSSSSKQNSSSTASSSFDNLGFKVISISLTSTDINESGIYDSLEEVGAYLYLYKKLPSNYKTKSSMSYVKSNHTASNKLSIGGDTFYNNEGLLPKKSGRTYIECDIDYTGGNRNSKRIVFCAKDDLYFYTSDHYESYSILRFYYE